jgi:hypothetical protein
MFRFTKVMFIIVAAFIVVGIGFRVMLVYNAYNDGNGQLYQIDVNNFNTVETYLTREYVVDPNTKCITFKDEMHLQRTVCNNYTITKY